MIDLCTHKIQSNTKGCQVDILNVKDLLWTIPLNCEANYEMQIRMVRIVHVSINIANRLIILMNNNIRNKSPERGYKKYNDLKNERMSWEGGRERERGEERS